MKKISNNIALIVALSCSLTACKKYLDERPNVALQIATSVEVLQGVLDNNRYFNWLGTYYAEAAADNYYLTYPKFQALAFDGYRNNYLWQTNPYLGLQPNSTGWAGEYYTVYQANVVLDNLPKIARTESNASAWDMCKSEALVFRAKSFYEIAQVWTLGYDASTANSDLGIVLRLTSDFNVKSTRSTLAGTYNQIIADLKQALPSLPNLPSHQFRPSKASAYGLLSRTYLTMRNYATAKLYADSCLQLSNMLLDYNTLNPVAGYPFPQFANPEDIMHSFCQGAGPLTNTIALVDTNLYQSYDPNDLRKNLFFKKNADGTIAFKGSYDGRNTIYNGVTTDEIYLTRAECEARAGDSQAALTDLNKLLINRYKTGTFVPITAATSNDALNTILVERRKELLMRCLRWTDIKRLNKEGANITLTRVLNGQTYTLTPNSLRYALPIQQDVINASGIPQNPGY